MDLFTSQIELASQENKNSFLWVMPIFAPTNGLIASTFIKMWPTNLEKSYTNVDLCEGWSYILGRPLPTEGSGLVCLVTSSNFKFKLEWKV